MAHFAELDESNIVLRVIVVDNRDTSDENGVEREHIGQLYLEKILGGIWKQTSYNAKFRKNYAGIGHTYNAQLDAFIPPKPYTSWILDEISCRWVAPISQPSTGGPYQWDENTINWVQTANN